MQKNIALPNAEERQKHRELRKIIFESFCVHGAVTALCRKDEKNIVVKNADSMLMADLSERVKRPKNRFYHLSR